MSNKYETIESGSILKQSGRCGMKEHPMLFSAPMVRAILAGQKVQTRRILKNTGLYAIEPHHGAETAARERAALATQCPYGQPGDRLVAAMEIKSVCRNYCAGSDGVIYSRSRGEWRPLKAHTNGNGYPCVTVMDGARKTTRAAHSLVCEAFYGAAPFDGAQVRHLDGDTSNSEPSNLAWGTQAENWRDRRFHGNGIEGEKHHAAKLSDAERANVRWAIERGLCSQRHAARTLGMTQSAIGQLMAGSEVAQVNQDIPAGRIPRILLEITSVRVEQLQDISRGDAMAEGCPFVNMAEGPDPRKWYADLWSQINGDGAWDANPWVWVLEFKVLP